jgi:pimeloyl-ACP methyl ester carboxylesterase
MPAMGGSRATFGVGDMWCRLALRRRLLGGISPRRQIVEHFLRANGLDLWCETFGAGGAPVIVLIMGIGTSGIAWDDNFCRRLAEARHQVVRFDNWDTGLSSTVDYEASPYTLTDMADDVAGLLDALATGPAHIVGASLGGMIAQEFAIAYPERTLTLTGIISTPSLIDETGQFTADLPPMDEALVATMVDLAITPVTTRNQRLDASVKLATSFMGSRYRANDDEIRAAKARQLDRLAPTSATTRRSTDRRSSRANRHGTSAWRWPDPATASRSCRR